MSNTIIKIKRSTSNTSPTNGSLSSGEPAYSYVSNTLYIGTSDGSGVLPIGGKYYLDVLQSAYITANNALSQSGGNITGNLSISSNLTVNGSLTLDNTFEYNSVRNTTTIGANTVITSFSAAKYRGGKFIIVGRSGAESHITELLLTHNFANTFFTEYGSVYTSSSLFTVNCDILGDNVRVILVPSTAFSVYTFDILEQKLVVDTLIYDTTASVVYDRANTVIESRAA